MKQESLDEGGLRVENLDTGDYPPMKPACERSPGAGPFQTVPNHWWYSHIGHRRRYRVLRLLSRKSIR